MNAVMNPAIHLRFDGRCREAFEFYAATYDGEISFLLTTDRFGIPWEISAET